MIYFLYDYQENIKSLLYGIYYLASITEKFRFRENKFHKLIASYQLPNITSEEQLKLCLSSNYAETINYSLAYLAGLDLYKIYKNDPELAIYLLQNIRYAKEEQNVIQLLRRNHITFMNDGYQNLKDHVKQVKKVLQIKTYRVYQNYSIGFLLKSFFYSSPSFSSFTKTSLGLEPF